MLLKTETLGEVLYQEQDILNFSQGIPGFEKFQKFLIIQQEEDLPFAYLQSIELDRLQFVLINPFIIYKSYEFELSSELLEELEIESEEDVEIWCIVTVQERVEETTVNLMAPVVLNKTKRIGKQVVLHHWCYQTKHRLADLMASESLNQGE
ncbi:MULTISPECIES: flagellar assembly protein FliW [unclassified Paenibacillus]|uniref:flagellar assembly protein FliW n=1 Tax=unclassified Paenibacillus TaxID=185978 RepID=UPI0011420873|nr:flagellar assembly protein FliW [Paenibacillus sp. tmac-D7]